MTTLCGCNRLGYCQECYKLGQSVGLKDSSMHADTIGMEASRTRHQERHMIEVREPGPIDVGVQSLVGPVLVSFLRWDGAVGVWSIRRVVNMIPQPGTVEVRAKWNASPHQVADGWAEGIEVDA